ncbi:This enzymatic domain is part of bacterial polyketide synthases and catalyses the first step in the reductive modification of the beta-carbonyl centres in the growing polyketide chain. It uses NADPH to reduce the keto group to a hydroxy group [Propionibacterium ruminifibrarum]|uniref:Acyl transferase domain-containing protein n=1 Tax=Propionibacterium ruminifibrarum TaxID=1962131 RepID=A0A375I154_9ACTN|nr:SDR family NAD(P)-dependent oxidoreductase [Propionibacterium ruminifibrarum]SPF68544.1 This enzymatic domain is part of bacterial polyketide synthases and catalyses the first step in the reductive modification of the beta-carbonyl centres in the growing polyketide chain. It uses NADPH to reduce the keto group to a hydroxy group [Propionibacterium ruminifibrarum]
MSGIEFRPSQDIAIIGMSARTSLGSDCDELWQALVEQRSAVRPLTRDHLETDAIYRADPDQFGGIEESLFNAPVPEADKFDAGFFRITPREARTMDPQQRLLLEETQHCIDDSGVGIAELRRGDTCVYVGATGNDYALLAFQQGVDTDPYAPLGNFSCMLANRISHTFGLQGESMSLDTACSSSLVAIDLACRQLRSGAGNYGVAAGVCLTNHPWRFVSFSRAHMMSPDGVCRAFDAQANGFVQGEGIGVLLLERLEDAQRKKHRILGVIKGGAVSFGAGVASVSAPNPAAQQRVVGAALTRAGIDPAMVGFIEAHGTGTSLGDPIEIESLTRAFRNINPDTPDQICGVGSIKTNVGHLSSAAGVIGVIKVLMMMRERTLTPSRNLIEENPLIGFSHTPFYPVREVSSWTPVTGQEVLVAGVSGFGFGGVNGHLVITSAPTRPPSTPPRRSVPLLVSAHTPGSLKRLETAWADFARAPRGRDADHEAVVRSAMVGREPQPFRRSAMMGPADSLSDVVADLTGPSEENVQEPLGLTLGPVAWGSLAPDPGEGSSVRRVRDMLRESHLDELADEVVGGLFAGMILLENVEGISYVVCGRDQGLIGLILCGALSPADGFIAYRDRSAWSDLQVNRPDVELRSGDGRPWLRPTELPVGYLADLVSAVREDIAVSSADTDAILQMFNHQFTYQRFVKQWLESLRAVASVDSPIGQLATDHRGLVVQLAGTEAGRLALGVIHESSRRRIQRKWALHEADSATAIAELGRLVDGGHLGMDAVMELLLADVDANDISLSGLESLTPARISEDFPMLYAAQQAPGSLDQVMARLDGHSPAGATALCVGDGQRIVSSVGACDDLAQAITTLWTAGAQVHWDTLYEFVTEPASIPMTQFDRQRYWINPAVIPSPGSNQRTFPLLGSPAESSVDSASGASVVVTTISAEQSVVRDHVVGDVAILPGTAYVELAMEAFEAVTGARAAGVRKVSWLRPMEFGQGVGSRKVKVFLAHSDGGEHHFSVSSYQSNEWTEHAKGMVHGHSQTQEVSQTPALDVTTLLGQAHFSFTKQQVYGTVFSEAIGFDYGPAFQMTGSAHGLGDRSVEVLDTADALLKSPQGYRAHPAVLDASLRAVNWLGSQEDCTSLVMQVPFSMEEFRIAGDLVGAKYVVARMSPQACSSSVRVHDIDVFATDGRCVAQVRGFVLRPLAVGHRVDGLEVFTRELSPVVGDRARPLTSPDAVFLVADAACDPGLRDVADTMARHRASAGADLRIVTDLPALLETVDVGAGTRIEVIQCAPGASEAATPDTAPVLDINDWFKQVADHEWVVRHVVLARDDIPVDPFIGCLDVFTKSIRFVYPEFTVGVIAVEADTSGGLVQLSQETMDAALARIADVAYQVVGSEGIRAHRFVPAEASPIIDAQVIRPGSTYLVSGGAGGIALELVRHYLCEVDAHFVLLGRRDPEQLPDEVRQALRDLGSTVEYRACDVTDSAALDMVVDDIIAGPRPLAGVFHLAGGIVPLNARELGRDALHDALAAKVIGAHHLDRATSHLKLDFFVVFSSLSAVVGDSMGSGYALANQALNTFAELRCRRVAAERGSGRTCSVMWPVWASGALRPTDDQDVVLKKYFGLRELESGEAFLALNRIIAKGITVSMVLDGDPTRYDALVERPDAQKSARPVAELVTDRAAVPSAGKGRSQVTEWIRGLISEESGIDASAISDSADLGCYGIDSIMIINLLEKMGARFVDLPSTLFFERQTIKEITDYLEQHDPSACEGFMHAAGAEAPEQPCVVSDAPCASSQSPVAPSPVDEPIAVIGLAGVYPQSDDLEEFWRHLLAGDDCIEVVPANRWDHGQYFSAGGGTDRVNVQWGGFLNDVRGFDARFFGISYREGKSMDPQERLFLETVYHAFNDAGYPRQRIQGTDTAVYVGVMNGLYQMIEAEELAVGHVVEARSTYAAIPNRVSFVFDLRGPSMALDTMCSSSLTALHLACEELRRGCSHMAVAGGVNLITHPAKYVFLSEQHFGSTEGKCRAFGDGGDGYVPGEGVGAVILKPLSAALADGDRIHGVIRATGLNHGGRTNGFTVPNPRAQKTLVASVLDRAGVVAGELGYVEAHGTGTVLGDPIEVTSLVGAFSQCGLDFGERGVPIGSVKANIGHTESTAGIASLTKVLLQMKHRRIVPSIHADPPNPRLRLEETPLRVLRDSAPWDVNAHPTALISSFGAGGSNAHVVLSALPGNLDHGNRISSDNGQLIILSAVSREALDEQVESLLGWLRERSVGEGYARILLVVVGAVAAVLGVTDDDVTSDQSLRDLGFVSDDFGRLWNELEARAGRAIRFSLAEDTTVGDIARQLNEQGSSGSGSVEYAADDSGAMLASIARTLQQHREPLEARAAFVARSLGHLEGLLRAFLDGRSDLDVSFGMVDRYRTQTPIANDLLSAAAANGAWHDVARGWVSGQDSDWSILYTDDAVPFLDDLPGYRFHHTPLWIDRRTVTGIRHGVGSDLAPLRARVMVPEDGSPTRFRWGLDPQDPVVADHVIGGHPLVPAAAQIMAVRGCMRMLGEQQMTTLSDITFVAPIQVTSHTEVEMSLHRQGSAIAATVETIRPDGERTLHSRMVLGSGCLDGARSPISLAVRGDQLSRNDIYAAFQNEGIDYAGSFRSLESVTRGVEVATAVLDGALSSIPDPELAAVCRLDAALQLSSVFVGPLAGGVARPHVPAGLESITFIDATGIPTTAVVQRRSEDVFDARLCSASGEVVLVVSGLRVAPLCGHDSRPDPECSQQEVLEADGLDSWVREEIRGDILRVLASKVEMPLDQINPDWTFVDLGVDSVVGLQIIDELNELFQCSIRSTALFDLPTVGQLADHLSQDEHVVSVVSRRVHSGTQTRVPESTDHALATVVVPDSVATPNTEREPIAVIGMSGNFPGARTPEAFWELLSEGRSSVSEVPVDRWDAENLHRDDVGDMAGCVSKWGGFIAGPDLMDPEFFHLTGYESKWLDPEQRIMLTQAWHALNDAGYAEHNPHAARTGVFVGCCPGDYQDLVLEAKVPLEPQVFWGTSPSVVAGRIAYALDLQGPCASFDTACSSALTAAYFACESLWSGACDMALVGGVSLMLSPKYHLMASHVGMLSPSARCASFSDDADGFVPSEGAGAFVLKPLSRAMQDSDQVLGLIRGIGINQDGRTNGLTAPNPRAQTALIKGIHEKFSIDPSSVSYIEAHGTGTPLGDVVEVQALTEVFGAGPTRERCGLGSVKSNIGHASAASGVAGLLKILLSMRHRMLPASLNLHAINPKIDMDSSPFEVITELRPWRSQGPLRAGLSSFGFSGTNVHVVVDESPTAARIGHAATDGGDYLFPITARNAELLRVTIRDLVDHLERQPGGSIVDLSYTLISRRTRFQQAQVVVSASSAKELIQSLRRVMNDPVLGTRPADMPDPDVARGERYRGARLVHVPSAPLAERHLWFSAESAVSTEQRSTAIPDGDLLGVFTSLRDGDVSLEAVEELLKGMPDVR